MEPMTQSQVAELLGLTRARISQIEAAALKKLARHPVARWLAEEFDVIHANQKHKEHHEAKHSR